MSDNQLPIYGKKTAFKLSLIIAIIFICIMLISLFYARSKDLGRELRMSDVITVRSVFTFFIDTLLLYILFWFQFWVIKIKKSPQKRVLLMILGSLMLVFVLSPIFAQIQWWLFKEHLPMNIYLTFHFVRDMMLLLITLLFTALMYMWNQSQKTLIENQKLSLESLQNRYNALKNQIDPHFLFNSLNTLNGLIGYDDDKAHEYVDQLSSVFRYTMQNKPVITLEEELNFAEAYIYLMKIRFDKSLQIEFHPEEKYFNYYILPFGIQLLIENAIKHNIISKKYPLSIIVETTDKEVIRVKNSINLKSENASSGIGLANLDERYRLMFGKEITISQDNDFFTVEIPLIKEMEKYNNKKLAINHESGYC